jgi:hypothetical protein
LTVRYHDRMPSAEDEVIRIVGRSAQHLPGGESVPGVGPAVDVANGLDRLVHNRGLRCRLNRDLLVRRSRGRGRLVDR